MGKEKDSLFIAIIGLLIITGITGIFLYFRRVRRILRSRLDALQAAKAQVALHSAGLAKVRGTPEEQVAFRMLRSSSNVLHEAENNYRQTMSRFLYCIPGYLMGFRKNICKMK